MRRKKKKIHHDLEKALTSLSSRLHSISSNKSFMVPAQHSVTHTCIPFLSAAAAAAFPRSSLSPDGHCISFSLSPSLSRSWSYLRPNCHVSAIHLQEKELLILRGMCIDSQREGGSSSRIDEEGDGDRRGGSACVERIPIKHNKNKKSPLPPESLSVCLPLTLFSCSIDSAQSSLHRVVPYITAHPLFAPLPLFFFFPLFSASLHHSLPPCEVGGKMTMRSGV